MAEVVEYALVVMVSALFLTGSAAAYDTFAVYMSQLQLRATFASVSALASQAMVNGSSRGSLDLPGSTLLCAQGNLTMASGSESLSRVLPLACDFEQKVTPGPHVLSFSVRSSHLDVLVS